jgi:hypothetical protein
MNGSFSYASRRARLLYVASSCVWCFGCASTTLYSGKTPGETAPGYDARWHPTFLFGSVEYSDVQDLDVACPSGWSEIHVGPDAFTVGASLLTAFIYTPTRVTIVCAARDPTLPPQLFDYTAKTERSKSGS